MDNMYLISLFIIALIIPLCVTLCVITYCCGYHDGYAKCEKEWQKQPNTDCKAASR